LPIPARATPYVLGELLDDAAHSNQSLVCHRGFKGFGLAAGRLVKQSVQPRRIARDRIALSPWSRPRA